MKSLLGEHLLWLLLSVVILISIVAILHYLFIGPREFTLEKGETLYYSLATRLVHWTAAVSCTVLIGTGMVIVFGGTAGFKEVLGGTEAVAFNRFVHAMTAVVFSLSVLIMFLQWFIPMIPRKHDMRWLRVAGGYFSKKMHPLPAHRFNAGQKVWFWLATSGGLVMAGTGLSMYMLWGSMSLLRAMALVHHAFAVAIVAMYAVHIYLTLFAIKGPIHSMIDGKKSVEEVAILHSLYYKELEQKDRLPAQARAHHTAPSKP